MVENSAEGKHIALDVSTGIYRMAAISSPVLVVRR